MDQATRRLSPENHQQFPLEGAALAPHPGGSRTILFVKLVFGPKLSPWGMAGERPPRHRLPGGSGHSVTPRIPGPGLASCPALP